MPLETVRVRNHIVIVTRSARGLVSLSSPSAKYHDQRWMSEEKRQELMALTDVDEHCKQWEQEMNRLVSEALGVARRSIRPTARGGRR
jgi:outer membrane protease